MMKKKKKKKKKIIWSCVIIIYSESLNTLTLTSIMLWVGMVGWCGVSCILRHRGVQLILAYSWARTAILVAGKNRGGNVFISSVSSLSFLFLSSLFLSFISSTISSISFLPFSGRRHKMTHTGWRVVKPQHSQSKAMGRFSRRQTGDDFS